MARAGCGRNRESVYFLIIGLLVFVYPVASVLTESLFFKSQAGMTALIGKRFVFGAVGARLFLADLRQTMQPRSTATQIFGIKTEEPLMLVKELGLPISGRVGIVRHC